MKALQNNILLILFLSFFFFSCEIKKEEKNFAIYTWKLRNSENNEIKYIIDTIYRDIFRFSTDVELSKCSLDSILQLRKAEQNIFFLGGNSIIIDSEAKFVYNNEETIVFKMNILKGKDFNDDSSNSLLFTEKFGIIFIRINKGLHYYQTFEVKQIFVKKNNTQIKYELENLLKEVHKDTLLFPIGPPPP